MNNSKKQIHIIEKNKKIVNAVLVTEMMKHKGFGIFMKYLVELEDQYKFQNILGIKEGALAGQQGIVVGLEEVKQFFEKMENRSKQPRQSPETGELEQLKKNN